MKLRSFVKNSDVGSVLIEVAEQITESSFGKVDWNGPATEIPENLQAREVVDEKWIPKDWEKPFSEDGVDEGVSRIIVK